MLNPGDVIGILGSGQLGRMLSAAAKEMGLRTFEYTPKKFNNHAVLRDFAKGFDLVTFETENIPLEALEIINEICPVFPSSYSLQMTRDRWEEKWFLVNNNIPTAKFERVDDKTDLKNALEKIGYPAILKTRMFGYDGKGQYRLNTEDDLSNLIVSDYTPAILEQVINYSAEFSVVLAQDVNGNVEIFDTIKNYHEDGILRSSVIPSGLHENINNYAKGLAKNIAFRLNHVGVLTVEFFLTGYERDGNHLHGRVFVNEIAPRVHNSGHITKDCCYANQFEQHIRAISGWTLNNATQVRNPGVMTNILGDEINNWQEFSSVPNTKIYLYGKQEIRPRRKMGHYVTIGR